MPLPVRERSLIKFGPFRDILLHTRLIEIGSIQLYDTVTKPLLYNVPIIIGLMLVVWATPNAYQILGPWNPSLQRVTPTNWRFLLWKPNLAWSVAIGLMLFYVLTRLGHPGRFLYFQF
jgi:hypothetical protein